MDIESMRRMPHLSASAVAEYIDCGLLYRFSRIDKIKPAYRSDALEFGVTIHKVLGEFYRLKSLGKRMPSEQMQLMFEQVWRDAAGNATDIQYKEGKSFEALLLDGKGLLAGYMEKLPGDDFKVLGIEEPVSFQIEGVPVPIIGILDLIEEDSSGTVIIADFKTSSKSYSIDEIDNNDQMTIYSMAARSSTFKDKEVLLRLDVLVKTKVPKFEQHYTVRTERDYNKMANKIKSVWKGITHGVYVPNTSSWKCKGCFYKRHCEEWLGGKHDT